MMMANEMVVPLGLALLILPACTAKPGRTAATPWEVGPVSADAGGDASTDASFDATVDAPAPPADASHSDGSDTTPADATVEREPIAMFEYRRSQQSGCLGSCVYGFSVNVIGGVMARIDSGLTYPISNQDRLDFKASVLTHQTYERMLNGWQCPAADPNYQYHWVFQARALVNGTYQLEEQDITGCIEQDSAQTHAIMAKFKQLQIKYFN